MKDLFVLTADLDALAVMRAVPGRPQAIGIRPISFEIDRHPMRDSGVVSTGPELVRLRKTTFDRVLLLWDHHGSGWEIGTRPVMLSEPSALGWRP